MTIVSASSCTEVGLSTDTVGTHLQLMTAQTNMSVVPLREEASGVTLEGCVNHYILSINS